MSLLAAVNSTNNSCYPLKLVYVDRFIKVLHFSMSIFPLFPVHMSTGLCNYVVLFGPDVYFMTCKKIFELITHFTRIIIRAWTLRIYKYVIISGR